MDANERLRERLIALLAEYIGQPGERIGSETLLARDLGLGGDDALELLDELAREFGLNLESFCYRNHFPTEGELCSPLYYFRSMFRCHRPIDDLTVAELLEILTSLADDGIGSESVGQNRTTRP